MEQRGLAGGRVMMDERRMVALSGNVVASTAARPGKIGAAPLRSPCARLTLSVVAQSPRHPLPPRTAWTSPEPPRRPASPSPSTPSSTSSSSSTPTALSLRPRGEAPSSPPSPARARTPPCLPLAHPRALARTEPRPSLQRSAPLSRSPRAPPDPPPPAARPRAPPSLLLKLPLLLAVGPPPLLLILLPLARARSRWLRPAAPAPCYILLRPRAAAAPTEPPLLRSPHPRIASVAPCHRRLSSDRPSLPPTAANDCDPAPVRLAGACLVAAFGHCATACSRVHAHGPARARPPPCSARSLPAGASRRSPAVAARGLLVRVCPFGRPPRRPFAR
nr:vegetative cell wall protein gp1-like [Aegilops tauschii subsp. strangulata]